MKGKQVLENNLLSFIDIKVLILIITASLAIYYFFQKIQKKVVAQFITSWEMFSEPYISKLVVTNKRDNTLAIWSAHATIYEDIRIELETFDIPLILKPYETISISLPKYSTLLLNDQEYKPNYSFESTKIYLDIGTKFLACESEVKKDILHHYREAQKYTSVFNGHVFNKDVSYILVYSLEGKAYTAFFSSNGAIGNEWEFAPNHIGTNVNVEEIKSMLRQFGYDKLFTTITCFSVSFPETTIVFRKQVNGELS